MPDSIDHNFRSSISSLFALIAFGLLVFGIGHVGYESTQQNFYNICLGYTIAFLGYFWLSRQVPPVWSIILAAIVTRIILLPAFPTLSDDIYRYLWDGRLILEGTSPFAFTPTALLEIKPSIDTHRIYPLLNSPNYYSIYPPVSQFCFAMSAWLGSGLLSSTIILKGCILIIEGSGLWAMFHLLKQNTPDYTKWFLLYALNPLLIIEIYGNVHLEGLAIGFALLSLLALHSKHSVYAGVLLALAVGAKLIPIVLFPYMWQQSNKSERSIFAVSFIATSFVLFLPILLTLDIGNFLVSLDLYFRKFEFNASVYYLQRAIGQWISGYNLIQYIGPINALLVLWLALRMWLQNQVLNPVDSLKPVQSAFFILLVFYLTTTTMHPWYAVYLIAFGVLIQNPVGVIWSSLIWLSYHFYHQGQWSENPMIWSLQYIPLLCFLIWQYLKGIYASHTIEK